MQLNTIIPGDVLDILPTLPAHSIDCIVTSPPYYGLRDYGTGKWIGGDPSCSHLGKRFRIRENVNLHTDSGGSDVKNKEIFQPQKNVCATCGALRSDSQIGLEETPQEYIDKLVGVFSECRRILKKTGTMWLNIGDSYAAKGKRRTRAQASEGSTLSRSMATQEQCLHQQNKVVAGYRPKELMGIPWMLAFALRSSGWYLRQDIIWDKPNPMPESVTDRCVKSHEYIFLLSSSQKYYFDYKAIRKPMADYEVKRRLREKQQGFTGKRKIGRDGKTGLTDQSSNGIIRDRDAQYTLIEEGMANKRSVWTVSSKPYPGAHFATFPPDLIHDCIHAGCPPGGIVLDPFMGAGTTAVVARKLGMKYVGIELNPDYIVLANERIRKEVGERFL